MWIIPFIFAGAWGASRIFDPKKTADFFRSNFAIVTNAAKMTAQQTNANNLIESEALRKAREFLIVSEGKVNKVYRDTEGFLTAGIGHKLTPSELRIYKLNDPVSEDQVNKWFAADIQTAFNAAKSQARELKKYTVEMIAALTEVNFQLGIYWRSKFPNTWTDLKAGKAESAIYRLQQSQWYRQTPRRVANFIQAIENTYS